MSHVYMSQVSKVNLHASIQTGIYDQFYWVISECKSRGELESLLNELLSKTERIMLAKRLAIAVLLTKGYSYRDIRSVLRVSFPTIRNVQFWLNHGGKGYSKAVKEILARGKIIDWFKNIDRLLDRVIPRQLS